MSTGAGDVGIVQTLIQAGTLTTALTAFGGAIAWLYQRRDKRRDAQRREERKDEDEAAEERKFYDARAQSEIKRIEKERDTLIEELRVCRDSREALIRKNYEDRESWSDCLHEARRCQQLIVSLFLNPPAPGTPPPQFALLPDPRRRPDPA